VEKEQQYIVFTRTCRHNRAFWPSEGADRFILFSCLIIDLSNDHHIGYWNVILPGYGGYSAHPAPALNLEP